MKELKLEDGELKLIIDIFYYVNDETQTPLSEKENELLDKLEKI